MRNRSLIFSALLGALLFVGAANAQCVIGVYADAEGTLGSYGLPGPFGSLDVYVVMHVEATVAGVAYSMEVPPDFILSAISYGPNGLGLNVPREGGDNVGLGECALGFNGLPVLVAHYSALFIGVGFGDRIIGIGPNTDEDPLFPVYADCADNLIPCPGTSDLYLYGVGIESKSMGAVKSLFRTQ